MIAILTSNEPSRFSVVLVQYDDFGCELRYVMRYDISSYITTFDDEFSEDERRFRTRHVFSVYIYVCGLLD